jgi:NitT/TauT family transport system permease protein
MAIILRKLKFRQGGHVSLGAGDLTASAEQGARAARAARRMAAVKRTLIQSSSIVIFLMLWAIVSTLPWAIEIPSPLDVVVAAVGLEPSIFLRDLYLSFLRVAIGFAIAAAVGIPLGIIIGYSKLVRNLVFPSIEILRPIPPIAWIPLAILFFPEMEWMIIFLTFYGAFFPIVYNTITGCASVPVAYLRAAKSLGASKWTMFWEITLPAMLPSIFTGLHVAVGISWLMVVAGEMMATKGGVGALTWEAYQSTRYALIFVGMAAIGVLGWLSSVGIRMVSHKIIKWGGH